MITWLISSGDPVSDPGGFIDLISRGGLLGAVLIFGWLFLTDRIVSGKRYERDTAILRAERDRVYELLYQVTGLTQRAVSLSHERLELDKQIVELRQGSES